MKKEKIKKIEEEFEKIFGNETHFNGDIEMNDVKGFILEKVKESYKIGKKENPFTLNNGEIFFAKEELDKKIEDIKREERERIIKILQNSPIHQGSDICMCSEDLKEIIKNLIKN